MSQELDKGGAFSELITELTRNGEPFSVTKALSCLSEERRQRILHQWELSVIHETLDMKEEERETFMGKMQEPPSIWCLIGPNREGSDEVRSIFNNSQAAAQALFQWAKTNHIVVNCIKYECDEDDDSDDDDGYYELSNDQTLLLSHAEYQIITLKHCQDIVDSELIFECREGCREFRFECRPCETTLTTDDDVCNGLRGFIPDPIPRLSEMFILPDARFNPDIHIAFDSGQILIARDRSPVVINGEYQFLARRPEPPPHPQANAQFVMVGGGFGLNNLTLTNTTNALTLGTGGTIQINGPN